VIVAAHRPSMIAALDYALIMNQGKPQGFGPITRAEPPAGSVTRIDTRPQTVTT